MEDNKKSAIKNRLEEKSPVEDGKVPEQKLEAVYHQRMKQSERVSWKVKDNGKVLWDGSGNHAPKVGSAVDVGEVLIGDREE